jgi:hypothetical protein
MVRPIAGVEHNRFGRFGLEARATPRLSSSALTEYQGRYWPVALSRHGLVATIDEFGAASKDVDGWPSPAMTWKKSLPPTQYLTGRPWRDAGRNNVTTCDRP